MAMGYSTVGLQLTYALRKAEFLSPSRFRVKSNNGGAPERCRTIGTRVSEIKVKENSLGLREASTRSKALIFSSCGRLRPEVTVSGSRTRQKSRS